MAITVNINRIMFDRFTDNIEVDVYFQEEYIDLPQYSARVTVPIVNRDQSLSEIRVEAFQNNTSDIF
jgi:hypothetical protein